MKFHQLALAATLGPLLNQRLGAVHQRVSVDPRGGNGIMKRSTLRRAMNPRFGGTYALGWLNADREWGGGCVLTHAGSNTQNFSVVWMVPGKNIAVVIAQAGESWHRGATRSRGCS
jgi:hypothetical protein